MPWLTTRRLVLAALAAWLAVAAIGLALGPPLGHDEAAFAVTARGDLPVGAQGFIRTLEGLDRPDRATTRPADALALAGDRPNCIRPGYGVWQAGAAAERTSK